MPFTKSDLDQYESAMRDAFNRARQAENGAEMLKICNEAIAQYTGWHFGFSDPEIVFWRNYRDHARAQIEMNLRR